MNRLLMLSSRSVPVSRDYSARLPALSVWDDGYSWGAQGQPQRGSVPAALRVVQGFGGHWKVTNETRPHINLDAANALWRVTLPASGKVTLRYTVDLAG